MCDGLANGAPSDGDPCSDRYGGADIDSGSANGYCYTDPDRDSSAADRQAGTGSNCDSCADSCCGDYRDDQHVYPSAQVVES